MGNKGFYITVFFLGFVGAVVGGSMLAPYLTQTQAQTVETSSLQASTSDPSPEEVVHQSPAGEAQQLKDQVEALPAKPAPVEETVPDPNLEQAHVIQVVDGKTIDVLVNGTQYRVSYLLVDVPDAAAARDAGSRLIDVNRKLMVGKTVFLEKDVSETDQFGHLLRYVWLGDKLINEELVRLGLAKVEISQKDMKYVNRLIGLQNEVQAAGIGIWGSKSPPEKNPELIKDLPAEKPEIQKPLPEQKPIVTKDPLEYPPTEKDLADKALPEKTLPETKPVTTKSSPEQQMDDSKPIAETETDAKSDTK